MNMTDLIFDISHLLDQPMGTKDVYTFKTEVRFDEITSKSDIEGKVSIMKLEDYFNVELSNVSLDIEFQCEKCLSKFTQTIKIAKTSREFFFDPPKDVDIFDIYLIEKKHLKIDISELLRQEIILQFPVSLVCSSSCKGLCPVCGKNKNKKDCSCIPEGEIEVHPLASLKNLLNNK